MTEQGPKNTYLIGGAALLTRGASELFPYETAREFQARSVQWIQDGEDPVCVLAAPTGGGKTAVIAALAQSADRTLCLYPTNALANAQRGTLENEYGLDVDLLTGNTLEETGDARSQEVLSYATDPAGGDVVLTNPDVLQAILQNKYFSPGSELMRFFAGFDAAVYDEFHYYDSLGASGLLMQIKVLSERGRYRSRDGTEQFPRILLPSATPSRAFTSHLEEDLELNAGYVRSKLVELDVSDGGPEVTAPIVYEDVTIDNSQLYEPDEIQFDERPDDVQACKMVTGPVPENLQRFRYPIRLNRWAKDIDEAFESIAEALADTIAPNQHGDPTGRAAVIFNSVVRSNRFQQYLYAEWPELSEVAIKDNGYDTAADRSIPEDTILLNTTSKGEVGLDFDLDRLVMVTPFSATGFVQRIGRAGRHSPAIVDVFGLDNPLWPTVQSYPAFLKRVIETIGDPDLDRERLRDVLGLRAARALTQRFDSDEVFHAQDVRADFEDFPRQARWRRFLKAHEEAKEIPGESENPFATTLDRPTAKIVSIIGEALKGVDSLRGQSLTHPIEYPREDGGERTEYDLVAALRHYAIREIRDGIPVLVDENPGPLRGHYPGTPSEGQGINLGHSRYIVDRDLRRTIQTHIQEASWRGTDFQEDDVERFVNILDLDSALNPRRIDAGKFEVQCENGVSFKRQTGMEIGEN